MIFLGNKTKNLFETLTQLTGVFWQIFTIANTVSHFVNVDIGSHDLNLLIAEKLLLHSQGVMTNVQINVRKTTRFFSVVFKFCSVFESTATTSKTDKTQAGFNLLLKLIDSDISMNRLLKTEDIN